MSILNNLKDFFIPTEVEDDNDTSVKETKTESEKSASAYSSSAGSASSAASPVSQSSSYVGQHEERRNTSSYSSSKPVSHAAPSRPSFSSSSPTLQVILVKPTEYTDAKKIADHLMNGRTVVLVLEEATEQTRRRIIDFLIGVAYAMNGNLKPIANQTYIVTPHDVGLVDQLVNELGKSYATGSDNTSETTIL
ncbi:MAG: cell division protein SepF [Ruminococcus sp.]